MPECAQFLTLGSPQFDDAALARLARDEGPLAAWRAAVASDPTKAASKVRGDFAIALREPNGRVFLAVDRFAVRTLCYRISGNEIQFAERADALAEEDADLDPQAIFDYLYFHSIPSPRTIFKDVYRLPPGHCAVFEGGRIAIAPYWTPEFREPDQGVSFDALKGEFRELLRQSVSRQLTGGRPACFLSGGTDSSTVAGMIREATGEAAESYSIGFEAEGYDEMQYARIAAERFGTRQHEYYVTPDDLVRSIGTVAGHYDQPFGNSSALPAYYCARMAQSDGIEKILAGDGGDELFGGNSRYAKQRVFGWYDAVPPMIRRGLMEPIFGSKSVARTPILKKGSSYIEQAKVPMPDRLQMYNLLRRLGADTMLTPNFLSLIDQEAPARQQREVWSSIPSTTQINRMLAFDWRYTLADSDLPKVCGTTSLAGVEVGFPFLDDALLEFSLRLPASYKLKGLKLRWFFKEALRGFLPDAILTKSKHGFGLPFGVWVASHAPLKKLSTDSLQSLASRGVVNPAFIDRLLRELLPVHPGYYGELVWILMMLEQWMQQHSPRYKVPA